MPLHIRQVEEHHDTPPDMLSSVGSYQRLKMPRSAVEMLVSLRANGWIRDKWIWLNYVCLNQTDVEEKNVQVKLMGEIYSLAAEAIVYAGAELPTTALAMSFWERLEAIFDRLPRPQPNGELAGFHLKSFYRRASRSGEAAILSEHLYFVWEKSMLKWEDIDKLGDWVHRSDLATIIESGDTNTWIAISTLKKIARLRENRMRAVHGWQCDLSYALYNCDAVTAADPRDRIYGVLGMLHGARSVGDLNDIKPDYRPANTAVKDFTEATAGWTERNDAFDLIYSGGMGLPHRMPDLPSWVPDYTQTLAQYPGAHLSAGKGDVTGYLQPLAFEGAGFFVQIHNVGRVTSLLDFDTTPRSRSNTGNPEEDPQISCVVNGGVDGGLAAPPDYAKTFAGLVDHVVVVKINVRDEANGVPTTLERQRFLTSLAGHMVDSTKNDIIATCPGSRLPFVLRPTDQMRDEKKVYRMVGTGYCHALNEGISVAAARSVLEEVVFR
ncbi:Uu.00g071280.m01.CDS01 [Anthostomella pinea]|uniref:Uu.00g071280.m01.CDS01 n=1 Tax=Anthostomella pinea TaxID=933095 RepID=A0AAI8VW30_9PEZI|nr:Uu.00g071280.m01.CDS01 [Anthostomella pinea]